MNSIRKLLAGSLLAAAALATAAAGISIATAADEADATTAPGEGHGGWHHHHGHGDWMLSKLNLTDEQKAQVNTIMAAAGPQMKSIHQQMHANSMKLIQMAPSDPSYAATVSEVSQANGALDAQMITQREQVRAGVFKILTPAQQQQLATLKAEMLAKMQERRGAWGSRAQATPQ